MGAVNEPAARSRGRHLEPKVARSKEEEAGEGEPAVTKVTLQQYKLRSYQVMRYEEEEAGEGEPVEVGVVCEEDVRQRRVLLLRSACSQATGADAASC